MTTMASRSNIPHWEAPKFSFSSQQMDNWKAFQPRARDYLKALNIDANELNNTKTGWK